jgi:hypothetical protein
MSEVATQAQQGDHASPAVNPIAAEPSVPKSSPNAAGVGNTPDQPPENATSGTDVSDTGTARATTLQHDKSPTVEDVVPPSPRDAEKLLNDTGESILPLWSYDDLVESYPSSDDFIEIVNTRAEFFDLNGTLKIIANGGSASDVMAPLRIFLQSLDAVATTHPFVGIAILPFRAILKLELNRRANDRRILTLISQMADMMRYLKYLPDKQIAEEHTALFDDVLAQMKVSTAL